METANIVIIGGGIVGLAVASHISKNNESVYVFEKNKMLGQDSSSHNSGVIHSGIHYPKGSLKASLSVRGNSMIYDICKKYGIQHKRLGKLTVANGDVEIKEIEKMMKTGEDNGIQGLKILERNEIKAMEQNVEAEMALFTPTTGIVEPFELLNFFYAQCKINGAIVATETEVTSLEKKEGGYEIRGVSAGEKFTVLAKTVINCAGLYSDRIAEMVGLDVDRLGYRLRYYKGDYFRVMGNAPVQMLIYPVPSGAGLGIHLTPDLSGSVRLGPNAYHVNRIDYRVESKEKDFRESVRRFLPIIDKYSINEDSSGIRPKLAGSESSFKDFVIKHESDNGFFGFIDLIGIESPGLTASPAIGDFVSELYENEIRT
jgi:L-2-hydroxyglutarate oxidase LhgO